MDRSKAKKQQKKNIWSIIQTPQSSYCITNFQENLEKSLLKLNKNNLSYYICGDINVDLLKCNEKPVIQRYYDMLFSMGCVPLINLPTRITTKSSTLVDHIYTNNVVNNIENYILLHDITDHLPICSIISELKPYVSVETAYFNRTWTSKILLQWTWTKPEPPKLCSSEPKPNLNP